MGNYVHLLVTSREAGAVSSALKGPVNATRKRSVGDIDAVVRFAKGASSRVWSVRMLTCLRPTGALSLALPDAAGRDGG